MSASIKGFLVPNSVSGEYVASVKNDDGVNKYDEALNDIEHQGNAALRSLDKTYSTSINDAYSNYLSSKRGIQASSLGDGFKNRYIEQQRNAYLTNKANLDLNSSNARVELAEALNNQVGNVKTAYETEVGNMDKVASSLGEYMTYLRELRSESGNNLFEDRLLANKANEYNEQLTALRTELESATDKNVKKEIKAKIKDLEKAIEDGGSLDDEDMQLISKLSAEDEYAYLLGLSASDLYKYTNGLAYSEWVKNYAEKDKDWFNWLTVGGGYDAFKKATANGLKK